MKHSSKCPKCEGSEVIRIPGIVGPHGSGNNVPMGWTTLSSIEVTRYLCGRCGFSEEWIDTPEDIEKIRKKYK